MSERDETLLSEALHYLGYHEREMVLDSVHGALFNAAGDLEGNTEMRDVEWFSQMLHARVLGVPRWEHVAEADREHWREITRSVLEILPALMERIAHRCRVHAEVLRTLVQQERGAKRRVLRRWAERAAEED